MDKRSTMPVSGKLNSGSLPHLLSHSTSLNGVVESSRTLGIGFTFYWRLTAVMLAAWCVVQTRAEINGPCMGCRLFNEHHRLHPERDKKSLSSALYLVCVIGENISGLAQHLYGLAFPNPSLIDSYNTPGRESEFCHFPCQCRYEELNCQDAVSTIKDGCGCCYMCARQMGDMCSIKDLCDIAKNLYCDSKDQNSTGTCKGKDKNPCLVDGVTYKDGEKFQPECSQLCTCQNGFYGCINTCPQELQKPSEVTCHEPKLIQVRNKCCKEWSCQKMEASGKGGLALDRGLQSENLILLKPLWYGTSTTSSLQEVTPLATMSFQPCYKKTTDWTPCSATCDVGVSIRIVVDPLSCNNFQELQLCYLRPCGTNLETLGREKCTPTTRSNRRHHILYQDCISIKDYNLKFCTSCKTNKCCFPYRTRTRLMEFQCSDGKRELYSYLWIKKCRCENTCDIRQNRRARKGRDRTRGDNSKGRRRRRFKL